VIELRLEGTQGMQISEEWTVHRDGQCIRVHTMDKALKSVIDVACCPPPGGGG
jgi:hypothetical protein